MTTAADPARRSAALGEHGRLQPGRKQPAQKKSWILDRTAGATFEPLPAAALDVRAVYQSQRAISAVEHTRRSLRSPVPELNCLPVQA